jgi:ABC-type glycerol-3-phosphate transport system permease component
MRVRRAGRRKKTASEWIYIAIVGGVLLLYTLSYLYMAGWMLMHSFNEAAEFAANPFGLPKFTTENIIKAMSVTVKKVNIFGMTFNTLKLVAINSIMSLILPPLTGYVFARFDFKLKKPMIAIILITVTIPMVGGTPITYETFAKLNLIDNYFAIVIMDCGGIGFGTIIMMNYFGGLNKELMEAASLDGAGRIRTYISIMFPQAWPLLFCNMVLGIIGTWNNYMTTYLYLPSYPTVAVGLQEISVELVTYGNNYPVLFAIMMYTILFTVTIYAIFSKQITERMVTSGLKG